MGLQSPVAGILFLYRLFGLDVLGSHCHPELASVACPSIYPLEPESRVYPARLVWQFTTPTVGSVGFPTSLLLL